MKILLGVDISSAGPVKGVLIRSLGGIRVGLIQKI